MTTLAINYVVNPLAGVWRFIVDTAEIIGYARAAAELSRQGLYKEAKACMAQVDKIRALR